MTSAQASRILLTRTELGRRLGVNRQRVAQYVAAGMPVAGDDRIDLEEAETWVAANVAHERRNGWRGDAEPSGSQEAPEGDDDSPESPNALSDVPEAGKRHAGSDVRTLNDLRREREEVRVDRERLELRKAASELVAREDVRRFLAARAKLERDAWVAWASRAAAAIASEAGADVGAVFPALEREVREQLRQLADTPLREVDR